MELQTFAREQEVGVASGGHNMIKHSPLHSLSVNLPIYLDQEEEDKDEEEEEEHSPLHSPSFLPQAPPPPLVPAPRSFAFFTIVTVLFVSVTFLTGVAMNDWKWGAFDSYEVIVPDAPSLAYRAFAAWEDKCTDLRSEWSRLFSYALIHAGTGHWFFNMVALSAYGFVIESVLHCRDAPLRRTRQCAVAFTAGVVGGAIGSYYVFPFSELVGASGGVYGLVGLAWALFIGSARGEFGKRERVTLGITLASQLMCDVVAFIWFYNPAFDYAAHFAGGLFGFGAGLAWSRRPTVTFVGFCLFLGLSAFLLQQYIPPAEPAFHINPTFDRAYGRKNCCLSAFRLMAGANSTTTMTVVNREYYCSGEELFKKK